MAEQSPEEQINQIYQRMLVQLNESKILNDIPHRGSIPDGKIGGRSHSVRHLARCFASLEWHQRYRREVSKPLKTYLEKLIRAEKALNSVPEEVINVKGEQEMLRVRSLVVRKLIKYCSTEKKDYPKDLIYWRIFKLFRLFWKLKYEETIRVMAKLSVLFGQARVSRKNNFTKSIKRSGEIQDFDDRDLEYCEKEAQNIGKRLTRLKKSNKKNIDNHLLYKMEAEYVRFGLDVSVLSSVLEDLKLDENKYLPELLANSAFVKAISSMHFPS